MGCLHIWLTKKTTIAYSTLFRIFLLCYNLQKVVTVFTLVLYANITIVDLQNNHVVKNTSHFLIIYLM